MRFPLRPWPSLVPVALGLLVCGCVYGPLDHYSPILTVSDQEPNNDAYNAQGVGSIGPGAQVQIYGHVAGQAGFGPDGVDGFAFVTSAPTEIAFQLYGQPGWFCDLDLCLYDPYTQSYVDCWQSWSSSESGAFYVPAAGQEFHLVVVAASGSADYVLELTAAGSGTYYAGKGLQTDPAAIRGFGRETKVELHAMEGLDRYRGSKQVPEAPEPQAQTPVGLLLNFRADGQVERQPLTVDEQGLLVLGAAR